MVIFKKNGEFFSIEEEEVIFTNSIEESEKFLQKDGTKFGIFSFHLVEEIENIKIKKDDTNFPKIVMIRGKERKFDINFSSNIKNEIKMRELINEKEEKEKFIEMVKKAKKEIEEGNVYEVNLSRRIEYEFEGDPLKLFIKYSKNQEVDFSSFVSFEYGENFVVGSGSMELFLKKEGSKITSSPIKGTRKARRGAEKELIKDEKEIAENLMIVDMVRNDIGRIAKIGSVKVNELFSVKKYKTIYHLVSTIEGEVYGKSFSEIMRATFPPASVTGAPKISAIKIIDRLEEKARGPYCGAIGFFEEENFALSVAIRIFIKKEDKIMYFTGCGTTIDSIPEREWEESKEKTIAFLNSIK